MNTQLNYFPKIHLNKHQIKISPLSPKKKQIVKTIHFPKIQKSTKINSLKKKNTMNQNILKKFKTERNQTLQNYNNRSLKPLNVFKKHNKIYKKEYNKKKKVITELKLDSQILVKKNLNLKKFLNELETIDKFKTKIKNIKEIGRGYSSEVYLAYSKTSSNKFILKGITFEFLTNSSHLEMIKVPNLITRMRSVFLKILNLNLFLKFMVFIRIFQGFI